MLSYRRGFNLNLAPIRALPYHVVKHCIYHSTTNNYSYVYNVMVVDANRNDRQYNI